MTLSRSWSLRDAEMTERAGETLAHHVEPTEAVGLVGSLGAGKTCLTRGLWRGLHSRAGREATSQPVTSPTYTLINHYDGPAPFDAVVHVDLYRLNDSDDLESTGYWDAVDDASLVIIEWLDQLPQAWPGQGGWRLELAHTDDPDGEGGRVLRVMWQGADPPRARSEALFAALDAALSA